MSEKRVCEVCGVSYKTCRSCEESYSKIYFAWRTHYCSSACCLKGFEQMEKGATLMRLQAKGLTYDIKEYDLDKKHFVASNDKVIEYEDIEAFILTKEEYEKATKKTTKKTSVDVE